MHQLRHGMHLRVAISFVDEAKHLRERQTLCLVGGHARQRLGDRIQVFDVPVHVGRDHRVTDRFERDVSAIAFGE